MRAVVVEEIRNILGILNKNSWAEYGFLWDAELQHHMSLEFSFFTSTNSLLPVTQEIDDSPKSLSIYSKPLLHHLDQDSEILAENTNFSCPLSI